MSLTYKQILAKKEFLPFYVYDYETIKGQILKLKKNLPSNVKVYYSVKANPNIAILKIMKNFGLGAEIVSWGEFLAAQRAGFKSGDILFAGSVKTNEELVSAIESNIYLISLESIPELFRLNKIAKTLKKKQDIILRLKLDEFMKLIDKRSATFDSDESLKKDRNIIYFEFGKLKEILKKKGLTEDYGFSFKEVGRILLNFSRRFPYLNLRGIHIYKGSRIYDVKILIAIVNYSFALVQELKKRFKLNFKIIDIGGGFGASMNNELSVSGFSEELQELIKKYDFGGKEIILEPGRFLVNNAGFYLSRIIEIRKEASTNHLIVEGIASHLKKRIAIDDFKKTSFIFRDCADDFACEILPWRRGKIYSTVIKGQLSSISDVFGGSTSCKLMLPKKVKAGDFLIIKGVGAYGLTQAETLFGSKPIAAEFLLVNGKLELIRDKGKPEDFLKGQIIPEVLK